MFSDFHLHTEFSLDSDTPVREQIEKAIQLGMTELCITDHHDYGIGLPTGDFILDFESYFPAIRELKEEYCNKIQIYIGIELGLQVRVKDYLEQLITKYPFDFIIGSSHFINQKDPYYPEFHIGRNDQDVIKEYFLVTLARVNAMDCYDVLGHTDYIVRYGPNKNKNYEYETFREYTDPILKALIEKGKGLECNTGGFKYNLGHPNPCEEILTRYRQMGGEILTIGSDAHTPKYIGYEFERVKALLQQCGFKYYTVFHDRKPEFVKIT